MFGPFVAGVPAVTSMHGSCVEVYSKVSVCSGISASVDEEEDMLTMDPVSGTAEETINNTLYDLFVIEWSWYHVSLNYCPTCDHAHAFNQCIHVQCTILIILCK